jgi:hypothetical protein
VLLAVVADLDRSAGIQSGHTRRNRVRTCSLAGPADTSFTFGHHTSHGDDLTSFPVAGNFDGADAAYEVGVVYGNPTTGALEWQVRRELTPSSPVYTFTYGRLGDRPIVGDWNGDGTDTAGVLRDNPPTETYGGYENWLVRNSNSAGPANTTFTFGSDALPIDFPAEYLTRTTIKAG